MFGEWGVTRRGSLTRVRTLGGWSQTKAQHRPCANNLELHSLIHQQLHF